MSTVAAKAGQIVDKAKDAVGMKGISIAGHNVGTTGYGLMGLTWRPEPPSQEQAFAAMKQALDSGANFWNGGEFYGPPDKNSLQLLRDYFAKYPEDSKKVVISIKGGINEQFAPDGGAEQTSKSIQNCVDILGSRKHLNLWEAARVDPNTPIEVTMRQASDFVKSGKMDGISLSECSANSIRRAAKVAKISAVEVEFSLWATDILENGVAKACADLNIPTVAYSPLGRGFLTGQIKKPDDIPEGDFRKTIPRFAPENFDTNLKLVHELQKIAEKKGCTSGQIGLAWVKAQSGKPGMPRIIPIPGASTAERVKENMKQIDELLKSIPISGERYGGPQQALQFGDSPEEEKE